MECLICLVPIIKPCLKADHSPRLAMTSIDEVYTHSQDVRAQLMNIWALPRRHGTVTLSSIPFILLSFDFWHDSVYCMRKYGRFDWMKFPIL